jgi:hypothetical protein
MSDEYKTVVEKLVSDGSNWVTYRDRMVWMLKSRGLAEHLTETATTQQYTDIGTVNNVTPDMQWANDEAIAMQIITASIPNSIFTSVKNKTNTKDLWDMLKVLYEGRTTMVLVNLSQQLQSTRCGESNSVHNHFDKIANMQEQLAAMGKTISNVEYAAILIGSLPPSYTSMLGSISASAEMSRIAVLSSVVIKLAIDKFD